jgi:hypothetical protein
MWRRSSSGRLLMMSRPSISIVPLVGSMSRLIIRSVVVLPQPLGPMSTQTSPEGTSKLTRSTAVTSP